MRSFLLAHIRPILCAASFVAVVVCISGYAFSHSGGEIGNTQRPGDSPGCTCHCNIKNKNTVVTLSTSATEFETGKSYSFTIDVANANEVNAGCDISVLKGSLSSGGDGLRKVSGQLTHNIPKMLPATWSFNYTAPSKAGPDTIYATANAVNADGAAGGCTDEWNFAAKFAIMVTAPTKTIALSRTTIDFGKRRVGGTYTDTMRVSSTGNTALGITSSAMKTATIFSTSPVGARSLDTGMSEIETISFAPTKKGVASDSLIIVSDASVAAGTRKAIFVTGIGAEAVFAGQSSISFGPVLVGSGRQLSYLISNTGDDTLFFSSRAIAGDTNVFHVLDAPPLVLPGDSTRINVAFSPDAVKQYVAMLNFAAANGVQVPPIELNGTGVSTTLALASDTLDFGSVDTGRSSSRTIAIRNIGALSEKIVSMDITGSAVFSVDSPQTPFTIAPQDSAHIVLSFHPNAVGPFEATLTVKDSTGNSVGVQLHGVGTLNLSAAAPRAISSSLNIIPNPSSAKAMLVIASKQTEDDVRIEYYDASARLLANDYIGELAPGEHRVSLHLPRTDGTVFVRLVSNGKLIGTAELIVRR